MGESLSKYQTPKIFFFGRARADLSDNNEIPFFCQVFKNFGLASPAVRQSLISMVIPTALEIYPNGEELNVIIQEYFYNPLAVQTNLILFMSKKENEVVGFSVYFLFEDYFIENDFSKENRFFVSTQFGCIKERVRRSGMRKEFFKIKGAMDLEDYRDCNLVYFDVSINPISYYGACQVSNCVIPSFRNKEVPRKVEEFLRKMFRVLEYEVYENVPYLVKEYFNDVRFDRDYWTKIYNKLPDDARFFIDKTQLQTNVALAFVAVYSVLENNTLGLKGGRYLVDEKLKIRLEEVDFKSPRI